MRDPDPVPKDLRLIESEERYRAVIENASDMIQSVRPDGTFEFVNKAWSDSLGYSDDDLATVTVWDIVHPDSIEHCMRDFMRAIKGETVEFLETQFVSKDGRTVPVEGSVTSRFVGHEVVATHGFFRDISERLRTRALEERTIVLEREERARYLEKMAALGKLSAGLAHELNSPAAAVQRANASLRDSLQRRDSAMRQLSADCLSSHGWKVMESILNREHRPRIDSILGGDEETAIEGWLEDREIGRAWELAPLFAERGITVDDLLTIGGEVTIPALPTAIEWFYETLVVTESTEIIEHSSHRITELVHAIKGYSHMDRASEHDGNIHDGLENTLLILGHRLQNIDVRREYDRTIPHIRMYGNTLNQVWTNVIDNAIDALGDEGQIVIRTRKDDHNVIVEIEDDGTGIPTDVLPRIFEPFYTSKKQGQGTGLGLDTAWRIVTKEHEGSISATSRPGKTVFQISLPRTPLGASAGDIAQ